MRAGCVLMRFIALAMPFAAAGAGGVPPSTAAAPAAPATQPRATVAVSRVTEEGESLIKAVVLEGVTPVENASVVFEVKRTFGNLIIGEDKTLDDGSAAVKFPKDIPGGPAGELDVVVEVKSPPQVAGARAEVALDGGVKVSPADDGLPRALWAPHAPLELVIPIFLLLGAVWVTYAYVVTQLIAIRRGAKQ
jgi:hypothetical protein